MNYAVEIRLFINHSFTHSDLFIQIQSNTRPVFLTLIRFIYVNMCRYTYIHILFVLNLKRPVMLYEDVKSGL